MKRIARALALLVLIAPDSGRAFAQVSGDVSVRLFSTRDVQSMTLTSTGGGATLTPCEGCPAMRMPGSVTLKVGELKSPRIALAGELRVEASGLPPASAAGKWRIDKERGFLRVVLTVPRERYVMAVLARESAADDPPAALEALAIVVRSFALTNAGKHRAEGYDFTDSTESQAAQFGPVPQRIREAVQATTGETLWVGRARAAAYFSENCGGMTEDAAALWGGAKQPWLGAHADPYCTRAPWHAEVSSDDLRAALTAEGWKLDGPITALRVAARTESGRAERMDVTSGGRRIAITAESFRLAVGRSLGWNRLRSNWFTVSFHDGRAVFEGRGYGHGVGLCQAGARAYALQHQGDGAAVPREILRFYFPGADVRVNATDHGWQKHEGAGWTLISVAPDDPLIQQGNEAWAKAKQWFAVASLPHPVVRLYPETELFRQATSENGWALGATRGSSVSLQPVSLVIQHEPMAELLLHEFLHVLVESEAGGAAPLWLREGWVEWLATTPGSARTGAHRPEYIDAAQVDAGLAHAATWKDAESAHRAAGMLVATMVQRYGTSAVRDWLRNGVPVGVTHTMLVR